MKKILISLLLASLLPTLSACKDEKHGVVQIKSHDKTVQFVELSADQMVNLIESGQEFMMELYGDYCSHCQDLEPILKSYSEKSGNVIYRIEVTKITKSQTRDEDLMEKYPQVFIDSYIPHLYFGKGSALTYDVPNNKLYSIRSLTNQVDKHLVNSNISFINSYLSLIDYANKNKNYLAYCYDLDNINSVKIAKEYLVNSSVGKTKKPIILINKAGIAEDFAKIQEYFNVTNSTFATVIKNKEINKTIDYSTDGSKINDLLATL